MKKKNHKPGAVGSILPEGWMDWNALSLEQMVEYLREKYKYDSSGDAKCIYSLIEFYDKHKFKNYDVKSAAEKIANIFSLNHPVGSFGKFMKAVEEWRKEFTQEELDEMFKDLPNDR